MDRFALTFRNNGNHVLPNGIVQYATGECGRSFTIAALDGDAGWDLLATSLDAQVILRKRLAEVGDADSDHVTKMTFRLEAARPHLQA